MWIAVVIFSRSVRRSSRGGWGGVLLAHFLVIVDLIIMFMLLYVKVKLIIWAIITL